MHLGVKAAIVGRECVSRSRRNTPFTVPFLCSHPCSVFRSSYSAKGLEESASKLSKSTSSECIACPADVRDPKALIQAVEATVARFGKIDFVICGGWLALSFSLSLQSLRRRGRRACVAVGDREHLELTTDLVSTIVCEYGRALRF